MNWIESSEGKLSLPDPATITIELKDARKVVFKNCRVHLTDKTEQCILEKDPSRPTGVEVIDIRHIFVIQAISNEMELMEDIMELSA